MSGIATGRCRCGAVRFEADLVDRFATACRGTCPIGRMCGAVAVSAVLGPLRYDRGAAA